MSQRQPLRKPVLSHSPPTHTAALLCRPRAELLAGLAAHGARSGEETLAIYGPGVVEGITLTPQGHSSLGTHTQTALHGQARQRLSERQPCPAPPGACSHQMSESFKPRMTPQNRWQYFPRSPNVPKARPGDGRPCPTPRAIRVPLRALTPVWIPLHTISLQASRTCSRTAVGCRISGLGRVRLGQWADGNSPRKAQPVLREAGWGTQSGRSPLAASADPNAPGLHEAMSCCSISGV